MVALNGMPDFEIMSIMSTPLTNVDIPKKVTSPVAKEIQN